MQSAIFHYFRVGQYEQPEFILPQNRFYISPYYSYVGSMSNELTNCSLFVKKSFILILEATHSSPLPGNTPDFDAHISVASHEGKGLQVTTEPVPVR